MDYKDFLATYPAISAILSGVFAIIVTFMPPRSNLKRNIWIIVFAILGLTGAICIVWNNSITRKDSDDQKIQSAKDMAYLKGQMTALLKYTSSPPPSNEDSKRLSNILEQLDNDIKSQPKVYNSKTNTLNTVPLSLKKRTLLLSTEILKFLSDKKEPPSPKPETWNADIQNINNFYNSIMNEYSLKFGSRVRVIRDELAENGYKNEDLDAYYLSPVNVLVVREIGEILGMMSEKIKE